MQFSTPKLNDRRNLIKHIIKRWGPSMSIYDIASKLPDFLAALTRYLTDTMYLHELGEYESTYFLEEFEQSSSDQYFCWQIIKTLRTTKVEAILILTDSTLIYFSGKHEKNSEMQLKSLIYLDEIEETKQINQDILQIKSKNSQTLKFEFQPTKRRSFLIGLRNRQIVWQKDKIVIQKGSITGSTLIQIEAKLDEVKSTLKTYKPIHELVSQYIQLLSDAIQLTSMENERKLEKYRLQLKEALGNPVYQKCIQEASSLLKKKKQKV